MANLFWKSRDKITALLDTPFKSEAEFESIVFSYPILLGDLFVLNRQVRGGNKRGIPDIIGIDMDGSVCIIEMKNTTVDSTIIPQVLQYALWAEQNPDSIKALWLECENRPDELAINWDPLQVRILVIAPSILPSTLDQVRKINYQVDLVEIKRWQSESNEFLLVNKLEQETRKASVRPVAGMPVYDEAFYKAQRNKQSVDSFLKYCSEIENLVHRKGWNLQTKFNKGYCGFKAGFFNVFGIEWMGTRTFAIFVKLDEKEAKAIGIPYTKYSRQWKQPYYYVEPGKTKIKQFEHLFEAAYQKRDNTSSR